jgi:hypothetical protein
MLADAKRSKAEALTLIDGIRAGTVTLANGHTQETALEALRLCIADYDAIIARFGWRDSA